MIWELCELMINVKQGIDRYEVPVVGKNGKLNETIEVSALWSNSFEYCFALIFLGKIVKISNINIDYLGWTNLSLHLFGR